MAGFCRGDCGDDTVPLPTLIGRYRCIAPCSCTDARHSSTTKAGARVQLRYRPHSIGQSAATPAGVQRGEAIAGTMRRIAWRLQEEIPAAVARRLGVTRSAVHGSILRLRRRLESSQLEAYLQDS